MFLKTKIKDLTSGLESIKKENKLMRLMKLDEILIQLMILTILFLWVTKSKVLGLGGPALVVLLIPVVSGVLDWRKILTNIYWNAWVMYYRVLTLDTLMQGSGASHWLTKFFLNDLNYLRVICQIPLLVGANIFSGIVTNFLSNTNNISFLGPISIQM